MEDVLEDQAVWVCDLDLMIIGPDLVPVDESRDGLDKPVFGVLVGIVLCQGLDQADTRGKQSVVQRVRLLADTHVDRVQSDLFEELIERLRLLLLGVCLLELRDSGFQSGEKNDTRLSATGPFTVTI